VIRERVNGARIRQADRFHNRAIGTNAEMDARLLREVCKLDADIERFLLDAARRMSLSARGYSRILKVARTIADLEDVAQITLPHVSEALQYRFREE
jgi:magnesium chelatase family protein